MLSEEITAAAAGTWVLGDQRVHRMGFGSMRLTADPDRGRAIRVLRRAVELGVEHIDTAAFYRSPGGVLGVGSGAVRYATELIRAALFPYPEGVFLATKVGFDDNVDEAVTAAQLRSQVQDNLRLLGVERLDLVNLRIVRRPGRDAIAEPFAALAAMRDEGLIRHLGLSNVRLDHVDAAMEIAPVVCVQNGFALDLRRDDELIAACGERGIAFVPFFAIAGPGRESGPDAGREGGPDAGRKTGLDTTVNAIAERHGVTGHQVRLAWTLHRGPHVLAIPGTGSEAHLVENVAAGAIELTAGEMARLSA